MTESERITLADALLEAQRRVTEAEKEFHALIREANERGASTREIAKLLSVSASTVSRWAGNPGHVPTNVLEQLR